MNYIKEDLGDGKKYTLKEPIHYYSKRYDKYVSLDVDYPSDGATGAFDISGPVLAWSIREAKTVKTSRSWWVHDALSDRGVFDDGTPCTNWQASTILSDILRQEKRYFRQFYWWAATWLIGGGKARKNGMFKLISTYQGNLP